MSILPTHNNSDLFIKFDFTYSLILIVSSQFLK